MVHTKAHLSDGARRTHQLFVVRSFGTFGCWKNRFWWESFQFFFIKHVLLIDNGHKNDKSTTIKNEFGWEQIARICKTTVMKSHAGRTTEQNGKVKCVKFWFRNNTHYQPSPNRHFEQRSRRRSSRTSTLSPKDVRLIWNVRNEWQCKQDH